MPDINGETLPDIIPEAFDGAKYSIRLEPTDHKCKFEKINSNEIRCGCGKGYLGSNIDTLLNLFDKRK